MRTEMILLFSSYHLQCPAIPIPDSFFNYCLLLLLRSSWEVSAKSQKEFWIVEEELEWSLRIFQLWWPLTVVISYWQYSHNFLVQTVTYFHHGQALSRQRLRQPSHWVWRFHRGASWKDSEGSQRFRHRYVNGESLKSFRLRRLREPAFGWGFSHPRKSYEAHRKCQE